MQREELLHPAQFTLLKRLPVKIIKIELREREIWFNLSKIPYLRHRNYMFDSSNFCFLRAIGGILFPHIKDTKLLTH